MVYRIQHPLVFLKLDQFPFDFGTSADQGTRRVGQEKGIESN